MMSRYTQARISRLDLPSVRKVTQLLPGESCDYTLEENRVHVSCVSEFLFRLIVNDRIELLVEKNGGIYFWDAIATLDFVCNYPLLLDVKIGGKRANEETALNNLLPLLQTAPPESMSTPFKIGLLANRLSELSSSKSIWRRLPTGKRATVTRDGDFLWLGNRCLSIRFPAPRGKISYSKDIAEVFYFGTSTARTLLHLLVHNLAPRACIKIGGKTREVSVRRLETIETIVECLLNNESLAVVAVVGHYNSS
jgi:hypothetical protein